MVAKQQAKTPKKSAIKTSLGDKMISVITYIIYSLFAFVCVYPFYYIIINSISANNLSERGKILLYPMEIHFKNYANVMNIPGLLDAAQMSVLRTVVGTILTVMIAAFLGYMFTRETMWRRKLWYRFVTVTMYINAGIIPWFLSMKLLGMTNNFWGYIFPMIIQPFYIVLCKTYVESVPRELQEAAEIDGASKLRVFFSIIIPLSKPIMAVMVVFSMVAYWNDWFTALIYMSSDQAPLPLVLRNILIKSSTSASQASMISGGYAELNKMTEMIKFASIIVAAAPMLVIYPFVQKYFEQGFMAGAVKG